MTILFNETDGTKAMRDEFALRFPSSHPQKYRDVTDDAIALSQGEYVGSDYFDALDAQARLGWKTGVALESPTSEAYFLAEMIARHKESPEMEIRFWEHCRIYKPGVIGDAKRPWFRLLNPKEQ
jgi:hypothetical protein